MLFMGCALVNVWWELGNLWSCLHRILFFRQGAVQKDLDGVELERGIGGARHSTKEHSSRPKQTGVFPMPSLLGLVGEQDLVEHVDDPVCRFDVGGSHLGLIQEGSRFPKRDFYLRTV